MLVLGTILYTIRCRLPRFYGVSEIVVGVVAAYYLYNDVLPRAQDRWTVSISIAGAVYIIVRGYDDSSSGHYAQKAVELAVLGKAEEGKLTRRLILRSRSASSVVVSKAPCKATYICIRAAPMRSEDTPREPVPSPAMPNGRCRMHGGPAQAPGPRRARLLSAPHGRAWRYSAKAIEDRRELRALLRHVRELLGRP